MRPSCTISLEQLLDFSEGRLAPAARVALEQHLATGCATCQESLAWLGEALPALAPLPPPSDAALRFARGLARLLPQPEPRPERVSVLARLVPGSGGAPLTARGAGTVQRLYETDEHLITLWDEADRAGTRYLIGQVYAREGSPLVPEAVVLLPQEGAGRTAEQEGSEFHAAGVPPGTYLLQCTLAAVEIYLPEVEVGFAG